MEYYRWGKFRFGDFYIAWLAIGCLLSFSIASIILQLSAILSIFPIMYAVVWILKILIPHRERFALGDNTIAIARGKKIRTINLPPMLTLVVSYADVCPPLAIHTDIGKPTHILKGKFAVTVLRDMQLDVVLEALHRNHVQKYTTSTIQAVFNGYQFIYSFVCNQLMLEKMLVNRKCLLVVPESLAEKVSFDLQNKSVYIDMGY